jgi:hypothetical protein
MQNPLLAAASMDTSTTNNGGHITLKTSASGAPPGSNRPNTTTDKFRAETVRLPNAAVRRRGTLDPVPSSGGSMKKTEPTNNDKTKASGTTTGEKYVLNRYCCMFVVMYALLILVQ